MDQHETFDIWFQDNIVYASAAQTWNEQTASDFEKVFQQVVL